MKTSCALLAIMVCCATGALGQTLQVLAAGNQNTTLPARVILAPLSDTMHSTALIADAHGLLVLPATLHAYPYRVHITAMGYEPLTDTLLSAGDRTWHLLEQVMNDVVITGQYTAGSTDNAVQKIQVIDRRKIDAMGAQNLRDVLTNQLNVRLSQDPSLGSSMTLQGISGQGVKILIDGVPVIGRKDGNFDLSQLNLQAIDRIEIVEGPMSVNYGTDALAGTVNLITRKPQSSSLSGGLSAYYETMGTYNINGNLGFHKKRHLFSVNGGRNFFGGWAPGDKPSFFDFTPHLADSSRRQSWKPREQYMAGLQYIYSIGKSTVSYSGNYFQELIIDRGYPLAPYGENTFDGYYRTNRTDNAICVKSELAKHKQVNGFVSYNSYANTVNNYYIDLTTLERKISNDNGGQDTNKFRQFASRATFSNSDPEQKINYEAGYDISVQAVSGTRIESDVRQMGDYAIFGSMEYKPVAQLTLRPGLRYSYNTGYDAPLIPSLNAFYKLGDHIKLRGSYARGFRAPSLKDLYFYFVDINHNIVGNSRLKAEYSNNYSLWATYAGQGGGIKYKLETGLFYNDIKDLISLAQTGAGNEYTYINVGKYKTKGVQVNTLISRGSASISIGGSVTGTYNEVSEEFGVPAFNYSPELRTNVYYDFPKQDMKVSVFYKYTGRAVGYRMNTANAAEQTFVDPYGIADASLSRFFLGKHLNVTIGCKNLFDVRSIAAYSAGAAHSSASGSIAIGTGRYYFVKLDVNINPGK